MPCSRDIWAVVVVAVIVTVTTVFSCFVLKLAHIYKALPTNIYRMHDLTVPRYRAHYFKKASHEKVDDNHYSVNRVVHGIPDSISTESAPLASSALSRFATHRQGTCRNAPTVCGTL